MEEVNDISDEAMDDSGADISKESSLELDDSDRSSLQSKSHKQSYRKAWESLPDFKGWLKGVDGQPNRAFCTYCQVSLFAHRLSLLKHTCTLKHQRAAQKALLNRNGIISSVSVLPSTSQTRPQHFLCGIDKFRHPKDKGSLPDNMTVTIIQDDIDEPLELQLGQDIPEENNSVITDDDELGLNAVETVNLGNKPEAETWSEKKKDCLVNDTKETFDLLTVGERHARVGIVTVDGARLQSKRVLQRDVMESVYRMDVVQRHLTPCSAKKKMAPSASPLSAHVLDTSKGRPAVNVPVSLYRLIDGRWTLVTECVTDHNGRCGEFLKTEEFVCGRYKLHFDTGRYFELEHKQTMFPFVEIPFDVHSPSEHYHIPLILSVFGYSTYRGS